MMGQTTTNFIVIPSPYLPPLPSDQKSTAYTLVLDLDETLIYYKNVNIIILKDNIIVQ
jgi:hypothetical protein